MIALLCSIVALPLGFLLGFYLLLLVDPHYHDGISLVGGFVVAVVAAAVRAAGTPSENSRAALGESKMQYCDVEVQGFIAEECGEPASVKDLFERMEDLVACAQSLLE